MKIEIFSEQIFFTTIRISSIFPLGPTSATGCFYQFEHEGMTKLFLVTNKHVFEDENMGGSAKEIILHFIRSDGTGEPELGAPISIQIDIPWHCHPDPNVDLAIVPLGELISNLSIEGNPVFYKSIPKDIVYEVGNTSELQGFEEVVFVGYPLGLIDSVNHLPVVRRGITASLTNVDFNGLPQFLIDAGVYQGSSGSPVFISNQGFIPDRAGNVTLGSRLLFMGIVSKTYERNNKATRQNGESAEELFVKEVIGLGIVVKARCMVEAIEDFISKHQE